MVFGLADNANAVDEMNFFVDQKLVFYFVNVFLVFYQFYRLTKVSPLNGAKLAEAQSFAVAKKSLSG